MEQRVEYGSCFCGAIVAEMKGDLFWINYDHDGDCRKALGSPLTIWIGYEREQVQFVKGILKTFSKTAGVERSFCADCGSSIGYVDEGLDGEVWLTIRFLDRPERFEPKAHGYWRMKLPWIQFADDLPRFETYSRKRDPKLGYPSQRKAT